MRKRVSEAASSEVLARLHSRGDFLKTLGALGIGAAVGQNILLEQAFDQNRRTVSASSIDPTKLTFKTVEQSRPFGLISDNFIDVSDGFDTNTIKNYTVLSPAPERQSGRVSAGSGALSVQS